LLAFYVKLQARVDKANTEQGPLMPSTFNSGSIFLELKAEIHVAYEAASVE